MVKALGMETSKADEEFSKGPSSVYSVTDGVLGDWAQKAGPAATIRALNGAIQTIQRTDVIDALLTLTPLYRYVDNDNNNDLQDHDQGQGQGHQRPMSVSSQNTSL